VARYRAVLIPEKIFRNVFISVPPLSALPAARTQPPKLERTAVDLDQTGISLAGPTRT